jgi:hypothetical protein
VLGLLFGQIAFTSLTCGRYPYSTKALVVGLNGGEKMCPGSSTRVSPLLGNWGQCDQDAWEALTPLIYDELRRLARRHPGRERPDHTMQSATLIHEAYLRLVHQQPPKWQNRAHFFGVAAHVMRHILVDHAQGRLAAKREWVTARAWLQREMNN